VLIALVAAPAASAVRRGPCVVGDKSSRKCFIWSGKAIHVDDGDTMDVDIAGDGTGRTKPVRVTGINAMELTRYSSIPSRRRGDCHGIEAVTQMERLVKASHRRVQLAAIHPSSRSGRRIRRSVRVKIGGHWREAGPELLRAGNALWFPNGRERAWNGVYGQIAQETATRGVGLYDTDFCGKGPEAGAQLTLRANWDADGTDRRNVNGEWFEITNLGSSVVHVGRWWVRDSDLRRYRLPARAKIPAGGSIRVYAGRGHNRSRAFFWGLREPPFDNGGDGGYLFDKQGDLRAWMMYPCRVSCRDPLQGNVRLRATPDGLPEHVDITNTSQAAINLNTYTLAFPFQSYGFGTNSIVQPGETMRVDAQGDPANNTRLHRHAGLRDYVMADRGGRARLLSYHDIVVACDAWGNERC
jgi:endonuclease YncB( thermonuclease family)